MCNLSFSTLNNTYDYKKNFDLFMGEGNFDFYKFLFLIQLMKTFYLVKILENLI